MLVPRTASAGTMAQPKSSCDCSNFFIVCVVFSSLLALNFAYTAWYTGVRALGSSRTSIYSNVVPVAALLVAMVWLGERLVGMRLLGAVLVAAGVLLTRWRPAAASREENDAPAE